jgi:hypothetical protein
MSKIKLPPAVSPICLSTSVSLTAGNTAVGNMADLTSPLRSPMIIDEISFMVKHTETNSATVIDYPGGSIRVKLRTSRFDLTNNYVPIWNFGPVIDETMDSASGWASPQNSVTTSGKDDSLMHFLWKLPKPLFLRPGDMIFPEFQRQSDGVAGTSKVYITYHGRLMPIDCPIPPEVWIPYVSAWIPTLVNGQTYYVSNKDHFFNKLQVPLHVQRFHPAHSAHQLRPVTRAVRPANVRVGCSASGAVVCQNHRFQGLSGLRRFCPQFLCLQYQQARVDREDGHRPQ